MGIGKASLMLMYLGKSLEICSRLILHDESYAHIVSNNPTGRNCELQLQVVSSSYLLVRNLRLHQRSSGPIFEEAARFNLDD